ncbi:MAG TPA: dipeptide epimerase [Chloroflexota bacterium]|nr:dipeptide epimerase [Chloroflexota bacterium]
MSRGTRRVAENVLVRLTWESPDGRTLVGLGEAAPYAYYGELRGTVDACLEAFSPLLGDDPFALDAVLDALEARLSHNPAARAAVDIALHDLVGKALDRPLWQLWGLDPRRGPLTSYTIGLDEPERMAAKARAAADFPIIKIKVGTGRDAERVRAVRDAVPEAQLVVDANGAWTPPQAVRTIRELAPFGLGFVEQPVPGGDLEGLRYVRERSDVPLIADESCVTADDVPRLAGRVDGVNVKLMKCGGLRAARRVIEVARAHRLTVMCGCLIESSLSISAASHLLPLLDFADLDGNLLLASDPFRGVTCAAGRLTLPTGPGLGVVPR